MGKRTGSVRKRQSNPNEKKIYRDEDLIDNSVFDHITKKTKTVKPSSNKMVSWMMVAGLLFSVLLISGIFSPNDISLNNQSDSSDITDSEGNLKIPVVLYSSPTCGCCHEYVNYLNNNDFDTFQKRTEDYQLIKDENGIPEDLRSCHTSIIGDYFVEGHIPISIVNDLLAQKPDIDGITLPGMPSGSPGMSGEKESLWEISSIKNGENIGIFQTF
ncbi:MAG: DUF411 domain-containing protein [Candidatus Kariarchaeaceae archaeon]|jgi:hypothetical protein